MAKQKIKFQCNSCGAISSTWSGKCYSCGEWNTLSEKIDEQDIKSFASSGNKLAIQSLKESTKKDHKRLVSNLTEFDEMIGGGIVRGSVNLIAGQPGIGKSTLLLQIAFNLAKNYKVLYVSGEESLHQIGMRAKRLGVLSDSIEIATSNVADDIAKSILESSYDLIIVDSIQTISCNGVSSAAGSVSQITNSTNLLTYSAKKSDTALIIVGHVTKEGSIAGPKVLEHLVDVVLQIEGDRYGGFKIIRPIKNRFGSTSESAIFEMTEKGMEPVNNPSAALLAERQVTDGSVVMATIEGSRPLLVEVQALVNKTSYGYPKRAASGIDLNRLNLLVAMLEKRTKLDLSDKDIYINIVGGIKLNEPASDLAICMAIASASKSMMLKKNLVVFGEIGLSGEIRHVPHIEKRIKEATKLGFDGAAGPVSTKMLDKYLGFKNIKEILNNLLEKDL
jgi:DNA repair protein RadA/Sms